jgi:uncharacterized protein YbcI
LDSLDIVSLRALCSTYFQTNLDLSKANSSASIKASVCSAKMFELRREIEEIRSRYDEDVFNVEERYQVMLDSLRQGCDLATEEIERLNTVKIPELKDNIERLRRLVGERDEQIITERLQHELIVSELEARLQGAEDAAAAQKRILSACESKLSSLVEVVMSQSAQKARKFVRNNDIN